MKLAEEPPAAGTDELKSLEAWAHLHPNILKAGRCEHVVPANIGEDERDAYLEKLNEEDKKEERFKALNEDTPVPSSESAWTSKVCGDTQ